jgi:hypothetical protein
MVITATPTTIIITVATGDKFEDPRVAALFFEIRRKSADGCAPSQ